MVKKHKKGTPLWKALFLEYRLPWRYTHYGGFWNTILLKKIRHYYLKPIFFFKNLFKKEDITVIFPIKNRFDNRLKNTFKSLRNQTYNQDLIKIILVDYGSKKELIPKFKKVCEKYNVKYIKVNNKPIWNKSHCYNIAIKKVKTKYILSTDIDFIFAKNYIKEAINELKKNSFQVILNKMLDLPKQINLEKYSIDELKSLAKYRFKVGGYFCYGREFYHPTSPLTLTYFYKKIRGYDEFYTYWGGQDDDIHNRLLLLGLIPKIINKTFYLHQWHPIVKTRKKYKTIALKNLEYLYKNNSIKRNKRNWGQA